jgi:protein gp37
MKRHKISWLNIPGYIPETWNPIIGCSKISEGCKECYAEKMARRLKAISQVGRQAALGPYSEVITFGKWNGKTHLVESALEKPFHWKQPRAIFVCSMSDLFHENTPFEWIDKVITCAALSPKHIFIVLTKRPERMLEYFNRPLEDIVPKLEDACYEMGIAVDDDPDSPPCFIHNRCYGHTAKETTGWPLSNLWIGVTCENQEQADKRIPILLQIPAKVRFVSAEPLLGPISFRQIHWTIPNTEKDYFILDSLEGTLFTKGDSKNLNWVISGPENGPGKRPMQEEWIRDIYNQCHDAGVPFFDKRLALKTEFPI